MPLGDRLKCLLGIASVPPGLSIDGLESVAGQKANDGARALIRPAIGKNGVLAAAHAEVNPERELKAAVAAQKPLPKVQAKILQIADELWPDGNIPIRVKDRDRAITAACPNGETAPHEKTIQRAFKVRTEQDNSGQSADVR